MNSAKRAGASIAARRRPRESSSNTSVVRMGFGLLAALVLKCEGVHLVVADARRNVAVSGAPIHGAVHN